MLVLSTICLVKIKITRQNRTEFFSKNKFQNILINFKQITQKAFYIFIFIFILKKFTNIVFIKRKLEKSFCPKSTLVMMKSSL